MKFSVPRTVARLNNPKNETIFKKLGIDTTVSATAAILAQIEQELPTHQLIPLLTLKGGGLEIVGVKVPATAAVVGKSVGDLLLPQQSLIALIVDSDGTPRVAEQRARSSARRTRSWPSRGWRARTPCARS